MRRFLIDALLLGLISFAPFFSFFASNINKGIVFEDLFFYYLIYFVFTLLVRAIALKFTGGSGKVLKFLLFATILFFNFNTIERKRPASPTFPA